MNVDGIWKPEKARHAYMKPPLRVFAMVVVWFAVSVLSLCVVLKAVDAEFTGLNWTEMGCGDEMLAKNACEQKC